MASGRRTLAMLSVLLLGGCAVMDPYIRYDKIGKIGAKGNVVALSGCTARANSTDEALNFACRAAIRIERARSQIVRTRSGMTAALFPIAGGVGYNSARGIRAAQNSALTSGGLAGYSVIATLAQHDRVHVYDNGLRSISCAIGVYEGAAALPGGGQSVQRSIVLASISSYRVFLQEVRGSTKERSASRTTIDSMIDVLSSLHRGVEAGAPVAPLQRQLEGLVRETVSEVNAQITLTVPTNSDAFDVVTTSLQRSTPSAADLAKAKTTLDMLAEQASSSLKREGPQGAAAGINYGAEFTRFETMIFQNIVSLNDDSDAVPTARFDQCRYKEVANIGVQPATQRLMLGASDGQNNATVELKPDEAFKVRIFGGQPPYDVVGKPASSPITAQIKGENGLSYLVVSAPGTRGSADEIVEFILTDALGVQSKKLTAKFLAAGQ